jgi:ribosome biogenesis GTPase
MSDTNHWSKKYLDDLNNKLKQSNQKNKPPQTSNQPKNSPPQNSQKNVQKSAPKNVTEKNDNTKNSRDRFRDKKQKQKFSDRNQRTDNRFQKNPVEQKKPIPVTVKIQPPVVPAVKPVRQKSGYVACIDGKEYIVTAEGKDYTCSVLDGVIRMGPIYVGDRVRMAVQDTGRGVIDKYEPRQNAVMAPSTRNQKQEKVQAANVNQIILVVSVKEPVLRTDWLDRHLVVIERKGFKPIICCTKIDLAEDNAFLEQMDVYKRLGYRVLFTSSASSLISGIHELKMMLRNKTTLFTGHLGVGKTTLIGMLTESGETSIPDEPEDYEAVIVDEYVETKLTRCIPFEGKGLLIDTPGIAEYELVGIQRKDLKKYFREFRNASNTCFSPDCLHTDEPGCKIIEAVRRTEISDDRYQNYLQMLEGL